MIVVLILLIIGINIIIMLLTRNKIASYYYSLKGKLQDSLVVVEGDYQIGDAGKGADNKIHLLLLFLWK